MPSQRITEAEENYKSWMQGKRTEAEIQKMGNAEMIYERQEWMKKNMQNTDIKKDSLYTAESIKISWKLWRIKINANISSTIFYIFILSRIKTFTSTNNQAKTAFYAKEEGRQEKQRNKKLISTWKKHQDGKKPAWIYAEDGPNASKGKKTVYVLYTYLLINWTRNTPHKLTVNRKSADRHQPWMSIQSATKTIT